MWDKAVDTCPSPIEYVPDPFKTQEMYDNAVHKHKNHFMFHSVSDKFKTQKIKSLKW